jgi:hypothetical protein
MKYTLKNPKFYTQKKDGTDYKDKFGKPFRRASFSVAEYGSNLIYGNVFDAQIDWKEGDEVEMTITEGEYNGQKSLSFELPKKDDKYAQRIETLENAVTKLGLAVAHLESKVFPPKVDGTDIDYPPFEGPTAFDEDSGDLASLDEVFNQM